MYVKVVSFPLSQLKAEGFSDMQQNSSEFQVSLPGHAVRPAFGFLSWQVGSLCILRSVSPNQGWGGAVVCLVTPLPWRIWADFSVCWACYLLEWGSSFKRITGLTGSAVLSFQMNKIQTDVGLFAFPSHWTVCHQRGRWHKAIHLNKLQHGKSVPCNTAWYNHVVIWKKINH